MCDHYFRFSGRVGAVTILDFDYDLVHPSALRTQEERLPSGVPKEEFGRMMWKMFINNRKS